MPGGPQLSTQRSSGHLPCGLLHPSKVNAYLLSRFLGVKELGAGSHQLPTLGPLSMFSLCPECPGLLKPLVISTWHTLLILSDPVNGLLQEAFPDFLRRLGGSSPQSPPHQVPISLITLGCNDPKRKEV